MVEFAIVSVLLFMLFFALIDIGQIEIGNTASGNAAREGARVASLYPSGAETAGTPSNTAVVAAVRSRIVGLITGVVVTVTCYSDDRATVKTCASSIADHDVVTVAVTYTHRGVSPFVTTKTRTERATNLISGSGPYSVLTTTTTVSGSTTSSSTPPPHCALDSASLSSSQATISGGSEPGALSGSLTINAVTTAVCTQLRATFYLPGDPVATPQSLTMTATGNVFSTSINPAYSSRWTTGTYIISIHDPYEVIGTLTLRVSSSSVCSVLSSSVNPPTSNPPAAVLASPTEPAALAPGTVVQVNMTSTTACDAVNATFSNGTLGTTRTEPMVKSGTGYTLTITADQYNATWTTGLKVFSFANSGGALAGPTPSLQVNAPPAVACNVSVSFTIGGSSVTTIDVREHGQEGELDTPFSVTITPTGNTCSLPIYARWDRGKGFGTGILYGQAALNSNTHLLIRAEGGDRAWAKSGIVSFRFYNGVPTSTNQLTPLTPPTLNIRPVK